MLKMPAAVPRLNSTPTPVPARTRLGLEGLEERRNPGGSNLGLDPTAPPTGIVYSVGEVALNGTDGVDDVSTAKYDPTNFFRLNPNIRPTG